jgi:diadenosine tetraphosphate (Ap4A) HIT family hydrolase
MNAATPTAIHRRVAALRAGADPTRIARLSSGWLVLGDPQVIPGYCLLLPDPVVPDLNALPAGPRAAFLADMAAAGDVLLEVTDARRINYAIFGNLEPALHAHLFPRRGDEPAGLATAQPWAWDWSAAPRFDAVVHAALLERLQARVAARLPTPTRG